MSLISKIQSLISSANAVTGESRTDLTSAVQDLKDGYGGGGVEGDWLKIHAEEIVAGQNSITNAMALCDYFKAAAAEFNEGNLIGFSIIGDPQIYNLYYRSSPTKLKSVDILSAGLRYRDGLIETYCNQSNYDAVLPVGTRVVLYIAEEAAY